jgi:hypothetical protein
MDYGAKQQYQATQPVVNHTPSKPSTIDFNDDDLTGTEIAILVVVAALVGYALYQMFGGKK